LKLITVTAPDNHNYFSFGDKHEGSVLSSQRGWTQLINMMHSKYDGCSNNYGTDGGDTIEAITVDDHRFSEEKLTESLPLEQARVAIEKRDPIKELLWCILMGNHERTLWKFGNITKDIVDRLNEKLKQEGSSHHIEYGTYSAKITVLDSSGNLMYKIYETHGLKSITSTADDPKRRRVNMQLILKRHLKFKAGDCVVMIKHHVHRLLVCKPEAELYLTDDGKQIKQGYTGWGQNEPFIHPDARWYGCAGSFMRLYGKGTSGYAEIAEYDPFELGFLILKVRRKKIVELEPYYLKV
jgi:hypothetical protein